ncbi:hypothetical protein DAEQUDRAFT_235697 [Daedalea quercina L-15889]|uniref:Uncharacterized protein n=1 Tax=Daedalea quercina L-15889 TaxID=1314783 RepID=A0A165QW73_9APHY|nr:hypothetical protein DAEQUDRAFT_235697 [Daedalea quercina L-15889]
MQRRSTWRRARVYLVVHCIHTGSRHAGRRCVGRDSAAHHLDQEMSSSRRALRPSSLISWTKRQAENDEDQRPRGRFLNSARNAYPTPRHLYGEPHAPTSYTALYSWKPMFAHAHAHAHCSYDRTACFCHCCTWQRSPFAFAGRVDSLWIRLCWSPQGRPSSAVPRCRQVARPGRG